MPTLFVGIDVSQDNFDLCIQPLVKTLRVDNSRPTIGRRIRGD